MTFALFTPSTPTVGPGWRLGVSALVMAGCMSAAWAVQPAAETAKPTPLTAPTASTKPAKPANNAGWSKLSSAEQQALQPLAASWDSLTPSQQRKWLEVSKTYPSLPAEHQTKMHARMSEWAALSTDQRAQARLNFGKTAELSKELSPAEKRAKWEAYQSLPSEEKQKLTEQVVRKPLGAAPATQPVAPHKLATLPAAPAKAPKADGLTSLPKTGPATGVAAKSAGDAGTSP